MDNSILGMQPFTLAFKSPEVEGEFLGEVAKKRWPVLMFIFCFDVFCFVFRFTAKLSSTTGSPDGVRPFEVVQEMGHQLANMAMLYVLIGLLNKRARKAGDNAARQEEVLLSICMGLAICNLLASLRTDNAQDYVYLSYFLICTSTFLKIRWWVGTGLLATPTLAVSLWYSSPVPSALLPKDAVVHIVVAWAVGGLMAYLSDWTRRQMYANARLACAAHEKEMMEARARIQAQRELAAAQAQAAQRALTVAREKAAHEAKSEFMSLMCHEVRTPLNGCLASAEMLLETPLKEEQRELANTIRVSGSILLSTVSNFLDFFKLEAGKRLDIVRSEVVLADLVGDVHCIIEAMIGRAGAVSLQPPQLLGVPEVVCCDPDRLRGVLLNLYTNAAKFTKRGHIVLRVRCVSREWTPPAPPGYSAIMLQPSYLPSTSADRSMDMSARIIMPAQQISSGSSSNPDTCATASGGAAAAEAASSTSMPEQSLSQQPKQQQQHQAFWQQASLWALSLLPMQEYAQYAPMQYGFGSTTLLQRQVSSNSSTGSLDSLEVSADIRAPHSGGKNKTSESAHHHSSSNSGHQIDVHATSSSQAALKQQQQEGQGQWQQQPVAAEAAAAAAVAAVAAGSCQSRPRRNSLASSDDACWLLFEVEDTGVGITRDGLATLFREYVQGTEDEMCKPRTRGGTGLGLSICSKQVGVLGGVIGAYSCRGHGSSFWFKIPVRVSKLQRSGSNASAAATAAKQQAAAHQQQHPPLPQQQQHQAQQHPQPPSMQQQQQLPPQPMPTQEEMWNMLQQQQLHMQQVQQQQQLRLQQLEQHCCSASGLQGACLQQQQQQPLQRVPTAEPNREDYIKSSLYHSSQGDSKHTQLCKCGSHASNASGSSSSAQQQQQQQQLQLQLPPLISSTTEAASASGTAAGQTQAAACSSCATASNNAADKAAASKPGALHPVAAVAATPQLPPTAPGPPTGSLATAAAAVAAASATSGGSSGSLPRLRQLSLDGKQPGPALDTSRLVGRRVLLAEDNLINQTVARKMLSSIGMKVEVAANGMEAVAAVRRTRQGSGQQQQQEEQESSSGSGSGPGPPQGSRTSSSSGRVSTSSNTQPFSIILMDMAMPVMGGVEATRVLREEGFTLPIVAMTANASDKDRDECAAAGMNGFLSKPVLRDQLARAMLAAVEECSNTPGSAGCAAGSPPS